jgi:chitodextrinase
MASGRLHYAGLASLLILLFSPVRPLRAAVSCAGIPAWSATTTYAAGAQVTYAGGLYNALVSTTSVPPA